jgi:hypothetical protein
MTAAKEEFAFLLSNQIPVFVPTATANWAVFFPKGELGLSSGFQSRERPIERFALKGRKVHKVGSRHTAHRKNAMLRFLVEKMKCTNTSASD